MERLARTFGVFLPIWTIQWFCFLQMLGIRDERYALSIVHYGVITTYWLADKRRIMYVVIFIVSALLTPPDILTQLLMAVPLLSMYELILLYAVGNSGKDCLFMVVNIY